MATFSFSVRVVTRLFRGVAPLLLVAFTAAHAGAQTTPSPDLRDDQFATAYQINPAHTGAITFDQSFAPPLKVLWHDTAEGPMTYPLIARGKVFVWVSHYTGSNPQNTGRLYALDKTSGTVVWQADLVAFSGLADITYDNGHIFIVTGDGYVRSLNADSGTQEWSVFLEGPGGSASVGPPTAANGRLFVTYGIESNSVAVALDETNGSTLWSQPISFASPHPTLSDEGVFVVSSCQVYDFNPVTGAPLWHFDEGCREPASVTPVYYRGSVYDPNFVANTLGTAFDVNTGNITGTFGSGDAYLLLYGPAVQGSAGYVMQIEYTPSAPGGRPLTGSFLAFDLRTGNTLWSHDVPGGGAMPPLVVNDTVYGLDSMGTLHAYDRVSGNELWNANGGPVPASSDPAYAAMAAGEGVLVVPIGQELYALVPASGE